MAAPLTVEELIEAASLLTIEDRDRLVRALTESARRPHYHTTNLRGLGKEIWQGVDAQQYVDAERDSWES